MVPGKLHSVLCCTNLANDASHLLAGPSEDSKYRDIALKKNYMLCPDLSTRTTRGSIQACQPLQLLLMTLQTAIMHMKLISTETALLLLGIVFVVCLGDKVSLLSKATYMGTVCFIKQSY